MDSNAPQHSLPANDESGHWPGSAIPAHAPGVTLHLARGDHLGAAAGACPAPPGSARNSRRRGNHAAIIAATTPSTTGDDRPMKNLTDAALIRTRRSTIMPMMREKKIEGIQHSLQQAHGTMSPLATCATS